MKVGYVCTDVDIPLLGEEGCSVKIRQFCDTLGAQGHEVTLLCAWLGEGEWDTDTQIVELRPEGLSAIALDALERDPAVLAGNLERDLRSLALNHWLRASGPDLLRGVDVIYECYALFGFAGAEIAQDLGIPHLLELNSPLCREQEGYEKFPLIRSAERLEHAILRAAGAVLPVSPWLAEYARSCGAEEVHLIPNGVAAEFADPVSGDEVRKRLGLGSAPVFGYLGSFQPWHDVSGFVRSAARLPEEVRLLFVGAGPTRERIEADVQKLGLSERAVFTGHVAPEAVPDHLAAMTASVVPYREPDEGFYFSPLKLFESMAVGVPTIAAAVGQIEEVIDHGRTGFLYPAGDELALTAALEEVLNEPARAREIGESGRQFVLEHHTMDANVKRALGLALDLGVGAGDPR